MPKTHLVAAVAALSMIALTGCEPIVGVTLRIDVPPATQPGRAAFRARLAERD